MGGPRTGHAPDVDPSQWLLTRPERGNPSTVLDDRHTGDQAWSTGNAVRPLIHGSAYFPTLYDAVEATKRGDLVYFTDWQGDADERLTGEPGSEVVEVLGRADERGVDVRGLVWRSHTDVTGFFAKENRHLGEQLQHRGAEVLLDMRVRTGGSHHQKFVVVRYRDEPSRDVAFVGGMDLAHNRRDDADHAGDPQPQTLTQEYGEHPPWHDVQVEIRGPAVYDVETVFRERWEDPTPLARSPWRKLADVWHHHDTSPDGLPEQRPPPPEAGSHVVQLVRTYPALRHGRDYPFAPGGERSVARGYSKAIARAERIVYVEDQYFWGNDVADRFESALREHPELRVIIVIPLVPDVAGLNRLPQYLGRERAIVRLMQAAPGRVAAYGIENHRGTPVYVHAKVCVIDDLWASTGSDNFNRRSWTHDSELSAVVLDEEYARDLRLTLAAEHLDRLPDVAERGLHEAMADCLDPHGMYDAYAACAARLQAWHDDGQGGDRPSGRLRPLPLPRISRWARVWARSALDVVHDPDGRPRSISGGTRY
jgi:phosphatidylserine/phosphatidylglycerophosphate/cardiolipin synthase-like enzyme